MTAFGPPSSTSSLQHRFPTKEVMRPWHFFNGLTRCSPPANSSTLFGVPKQSEGLSKRIEAFLQQEHLFAFRRNDSQTGRFVFALRATRSATRNERLEALEGGQVRRCPKQARP